MPEAKRADQRLPSTSCAGAPALVPVLRERAAKTEALRRIPDETIADLHASRALPHAAAGARRRQRAALRRLRRDRRHHRPRLRLDRLGAQQSGEPSLDARLLARARRRTRSGARRPTR